MKINNFSAGFYLLFTFCLFSNSGFSQKKEPKDYYVMEVNSELGQKKFKIDEKIGLMDENDEILIQPKFDNLTFLLNGMAIAKKENLWGVINQEGKILVPFEYESIDLGNVKQGFPEEDYTNFKGVSRIVNNDTIRLIRVMKNGKQGVVDETGKVVIPCTYLRIFRLRYQYIGIENDYKGIASVDGEIIVPPEYNRVTPKDFGFSVEKKGKMGILNKQGREIIPPVYDKLENRMFTMGMSVQMNGKWGYYNGQGILIVPPKYDEIEPSSLFDGGVIVITNEKKGYHNKDGKLIVPVEYDDVRVWRQDNSIIVQQNGKEGMLNKSGQIVLPIEYDGLNLYPVGYIKAVKDKKIGFYHYSGKVLVEPIYDDFKLLRNGIVRLLKGDKWTEINLLEKMKE